MRSGLQLVALQLVAAMLVCRQARGANAQSFKYDPTWNPTLPQDIHYKYGVIFPTNNRNAASHLWS